VSARLIFELPLPENVGGNARTHWAVKHRHRKAYWAQLDTLVLLKRLPHPPRTPWPAAVAHAEVRTYRKMDDDNAASRCKDLGDWLQTRGYIANDRDLRLTVTPVASPAAAVGITLTLEPTPRAA
jgi:hypothetical protein